jgi:hypothetical protein
MAPVRVRRSDKVPHWSAFRFPHPLQRYPERTFPLDGHLVGELGEVVAAQAFGLRLYPRSYPGHDAFDETSDVQIKMTAANRVSMYGCCKRLIVLKIVSPTVFMSSLAPFR